MNRQIPVYLYGEAEPFMKIPYETFTVLQHGDMLSKAGNDGRGVVAFMVRSKEANINEIGEPEYALQVEEW
jgi:hypothetical protein